MNIIIDFTYFIYEICANFRMLLCQKCDVGYYDVNHGVMKLMIIGCFNFIITHNSQRVPKLNTAL